MDKITQVDRNMTHSKIDEKIKWYNPIEYPFMVYGFPYFKEEKVYRRLNEKDIKRMESVNKNISYLSTHSSGGQLRFRTNSTKIFLKAEVDHAHSMNNMAPCAECGFDCYIRYDNENKFTYYGSSYFNNESTSYECQISRIMFDGYKEIIINFPLYSEVKHVEVGIVEGYEIIESENKMSSFPMVFYGTSLTQGGCVSRPGNALTNVISRALNTEIYNFGFSGNGYGEYEVAEIIRDLPPLSLISLDYEANAGTSGLLEKSLKHFIEIIREKQKDAIITVHSRIPFIDDFYTEFFHEIRERLRKFQIDTVDEFRKNGDKNIYFINGYDLVGDDYNDFVVDTIHPTDKIHTEMGLNISKIIKNYIK